MTYLKITQNADVYGKVKALLKNLTGECAEINFSGGRPELSKPCGNICDFNISHSGDAAAIAFGDSPTGADIELLRGRTHKSIIARLSERERKKIFCERDFLVNWTAKEAFIKMRGYALSSHYKRLEFANGAIFLDGKEQHCAVRHIQLANGVACVCSGDEKTQLVLL